MPTHSAEAEPSRTAVRDAALSRIVLEGEVPFGRLAEWLPPES